MDTTTLIAVLVPIVAIQIGLQVYALYDIYRNGGVRPPIPTWGWVVIIIVGEILGPILYFLFGRKEDV